MQKQEIIKLLLQRNEKGMDALLLHYEPLMRYIIAPILKNPQDQEDCLLEVTMRVGEKIEQFNQTGEAGAPEKAAPQDVRR